MNTTKNNLVPVKVEFQGATLEGVIDGPIARVALKPIADGMGLDWSRQLKKAKSHPVIGPTMGEKAIVGKSPLAFEGHPVRTSEVNGETVYLAKDACAALGIKAYRDAMAQLDADERVSISVDTLGGRQKMVAITEAGIYGLMLIAPSEVAQKFRRWLKHELLPTLRKTKSYAFTRDGDWKTARHISVATNKLQAASVKDRLNSEGREPEARHFMRESKLVNGMVFGKFAGVERDGLPQSDLDMIAKVEMKNAGLLLNGYQYDQRKANLTRFVAEERAKLTTKIEA